MNLEQEVYRLRRLMKLNRMLQDIAAHEIGNILQRSQGSKMLLEIALAKSHETVDLGLLKTASESVNNVTANLVLYHKAMNSFREYLSTGKVEKILMDDVVNEAVAAADGKIKIETYFHGEKEQRVVETVRGGADLTLIQFVTNAQKYSTPTSFDPTPRIVVELQPEQTGLCVLVKNTQDTPIPLNERPMIWERFYRRQTHRDAKLNGEGIGLAIVKSYCEAFSIPFGCSPWFSDDLVSLGECFYFKPPYELKN